MKEQAPQALADAEAGKPSSADLSDLVAFYKQVLEERHRSL